MTHPAPGEIAAKLARLAHYADERRAAARIEYVDLSAALHAIASELHPLAAAAAGKHDRDLLDG